MTLASGAHVKLGAVEYMIDESVKGHYDHRFRDASTSKPDIVGSWGKEQVPVAGRLLWE